MRISDWILTTITALLCGVSFLFMIWDCRKTGKEKTGGEITAKAVLSKWLIGYSVLMCAATIAISVVFALAYSDNSFCFSLKRMALLSILWPIAWIDFKTYRVPNAFVLLGLVYRAAILVLELFLEYEGVWNRLMYEGIAAVALLLAAFLCTLLMKNSVGAGDMKLFVVMGLLLGMHGIWGAIFASLIVSFVVAIVLLVSKKKTRKDAIPFGPALVVGTFLSVFLTGM